MDELTKEQLDAIGTEYERYFDGKTLIELDDCGIGWNYLPADTTHHAYQRDYGKQEPMLLPKVIGFCVALAGLICLVNWVSR